MHFLYVARGEKGLVKIGITSTPKRRAYDLSRRFKERGDGLREVRYCPAVRAGFGLEGSLRDALRLKAAATEGKEWFYGLDFDETYQLVRQRVMWLRQFQIFERPDHFEAA